jgi:hypothetical protein
VHQAGGALEGGQVEQGKISGRKRAACRALSTSIAKEAAMAITVDSSQWTGQSDDTPLAVPVVWGEFDSEAARDAARERLRQAGAEDPSARGGQGGAPTPERASNADQVPEPDVDSKGADVRNQRQLQVGTAMAATSMAAAGLVIATGGAALPAVAAAAAAGAATAAIGEPLANAVAPQSASHGDAPLEPPRADGPVIGLRAPDEAARARAEQALRDAGARRVFVQEARDG